MARELSNDEIVRAWITLTRNAYPKGMRYAEAEATLRHNFGRRKLEEAAEVRTTKDGAETPEACKASYEATRCANVDCHDPENSLKVEGGSKVSFRVDVLITRGAPRFRVLVCAACYNKHGKAPEGYGRRAK